MEQTVSFGYWVRRRRKALDLTQAQLAGRVACAVDTIKKIESDARRPSKQLAQLLAEQLDVPAHERTAFIEAARGERPADRLTVSPHPSTPPHTRAPLPAFLTTSPALQPASLPLFVGRAEELAVLNAYFTAALNHHGRVVFCLGEAGSGKTALMNEFSRRARTLHPNALVV